MIFRCKEAVRTKIIFNDQTIGEASSFNRPENRIGYDRKYDIDTKFHIMCEKTNRILEREK